MQYYCNKDNNTIAAAARFQRATVAFLSFTAVVLKTPIPAYILMFTSIFGVVFSYKADLLRFFYLKIIRKIIKRELFSFKYVFPGAFLLEPDVERFMNITIATLLTTGVTLYHFEVDWWTIPIAVVMAGSMIFTVIGFCSGAFTYTAIRGWQRRRVGAAKSSLGDRNGNCLVSRNLDAPLYYRCTFCEKTGKNCIGMQINLTTITIIVLLLLMSQVGGVGRLISIVICITVLLRLGVLVNKANDDLLISHYKIDIKNRELSILLDAATAIASQVSLDDTLNLLAERITATINCAYVRILMADKAYSVAVKAASAAQGIKWDPAIGHVINVVPGSLLESLLSSASEPIVLDSEQMQEVCRDKSLKRGLLDCQVGRQPVLIAPIRMQDECFGIIVLGESLCSERAVSLVDTSVSSVSLVKYASMAAAIAIKNARHYQILHEAHLESIMCLTEALETRDASTGDHCERTIEFAIAIAHELQLTPEQEDRLKYAAILHDIGKIGIPDSILNKPTKLTDEEFALMQSHPEKGANLAAKICSLEHIAPLIRHHHERWDGTGYPDGLTGESIPIESRIVAVLDAYDAMTSDRVYRKALSQNFAVGELLKCSGSQFDPTVVTAFLKVIGFKRETIEEPLRRSS